MNTNETKKSRSLFNNKHLFLVLSICALYVFIHSVKRLMHFGSFDDFSAIFVLVEVLLKCVSIVLLCIALYRGKKDSMLSWVGLIGFSVAEIIFPIIKSIIFNSAIVSVLTTMFSVAALLFIAICNRTERTFKSAHLVLPILAYILSLFVVCIICLTTDFRLDYRWLYSIEIIICIVLGYWYNVNVREGNLKDTIVNIFRFIKAEIKNPKVIGTFVIIILVGVLMLIPENSGNENDDDCKYCRGLGIVNEGFWDWETCPFCRGAGIPPI